MGEWESAVRVELERGVRRRAGLVIGVLRDGQPEVWGQSADSAVLDGRTLFEIGSITKTFTALVLADGVLRGEWALDTPVRDLLPPGIAVPAKDGVEITLEHLATHTSGLRASPIPIIAGSLEMLRGRDPYADLTTEGLLAVLSNSELKRTPGTGSVHYSNLGVGVLGLALAHAVGISYADLVAERICRPLGLVDTATDAFLTHDQRARLVAGHRARGQPAAAWPLAGMPAAGGLRSTGYDMLRYLSAQLIPDDTELAAAIRLTHVLRPDPKLTVGLGWMRMDKPHLLWWHNGGTGGFRSFAGFRSDRGDAVVVLSNQSRGVDHIGLRVLSALD